MQNSIALHFQIFENSAFSETVLSPLGWVRVVIW